MEKRICFVLALMSTMAAVADPPDHSWHVLCITNGGTISLLKGLTKHEAEFTHDRALGLPATAEEKAAAKKAREDADKAAALRAQKEDAILRKHAIACPVGATKNDNQESAAWKTWLKKHDTDSWVKVLDDDLCGSFREIEACLLSDGSPFEFGWEDAGCMNPGWAISPEGGPGAMKSCEVFQ
jgi:hypothetical protein